MKNILMLIMVLFAVGCAKQGENKDLIVSKQGPFIASPTNEMIYEDCKRAIELYEAKDPNYATTMCIAEIRASIKNEDILRADFNFDIGRKLIESGKNACKIFNESKKDEKYMKDIFAKDGTVIIARKIVDVIGEKAKSNKKFLQNITQSYITDYMYKVRICEEK